MLGNEENDMSNLENANLLLLEIHINEVLNHWYGTGFDRATGDAKQALRELATFMRNETQAEER